MRRRDFITWVGGATAWPIAARAQQAAKVPSIGFLGTTPTAWAHNVVAFSKRLHELGWTEGRTVAIEYRWAEGRNERVAEIAAEFVQLKVDAILTTGGAVGILKQSTSVIPIVFAIANDPVGSGFVKSAVARSEIRRAEDIAPAFEALRGRADALYVVADPLISSNRTNINTLASAARLPTMHGVRDYVEAGGLMSYGPNFQDLFRRAAEFVDKILRGTRPDDIPVEQPTKFDLVVNLTTAKAIALTMPPTLLARVDEVFE